MNKKLTCEEFLKYFIEKATVDFSDVKFSFGCLVDIVERNKHLERRFSEFFDILVIKDLEGNFRTVFLDDSGIGHYCGDLRNRNERRLRKCVLDLFSGAVYREFSTKISGRNQYTSFLESTGDWPLVSSNERALNTTIKLLEESKKSEAYLSTYIEHAVDTLIIPVLLRKSLELQHDNLLKHSNNEYIIQVLDLIKWKSGLKDMLESFDMKLEDIINNEDKKEQLYKILL